MAAKFKPIIPKAISRDVFNDAMESAARDMYKNIKGDFEHETSWWKDPPIFVGVVDVSDKEIIIDVFTENPVFRFLDEGTKSHFIKPVRAKMLHWVTPAGEDAFSKGHFVSGIKPRKITKKVQTENQRLMKEVFKFYLNEAVVLSGHAMK